MTKLYKFPKKLTEKFTSRFLGNSEIPLLQDIKPVAVEEIIAAEYLIIQNQIELLKYKINKKLSKYLTTNNSVSVKVRKFDKSVVREVIKIYRNAGFGVCSGGTWCEPILAISTNKSINKGNKNEQ